MSISDILKKNMGINTSKPLERNEKEKKYWRELDQKKPTLKLPEYEQVYKAFIKHSEKYCSKLIIDKTNTKFLNFMMFYFLGVNKYPEYDLNKGLLISGSCGLGKTMTFKILKEIFKYYPDKVFRMTSANQIVREYDSTGSECLDKYLVNKWCFDDFGTENTAKHYGKDEEVFKTIIEERYNLFIDHNIPTYLTTNLNLTEIRRRYGSRVYSRLFEMFNIILLKGEDKRL